ncbi:MAG TPA: nicotinate-nucleotide adenylyltransferase [Candidatus Xenobia bacterium]|nr:nicotinate-nucleotide adenylyltransferase [Candidatus Xenobia bacterium]
MRALRIGILGGTFDPVHTGHLAVARAARRRFRLDLVYFIPCGLPPHKPRRKLSPFLHRFTMVALACAGEPAFAPSLLEAGADLRGEHVTYSIDTVRRLRRMRPRARLYFLLGADALLLLPQWKNIGQLVRLCEFVVAARPGIDRRKLARVAVPNATVHFLGGVDVDVSASQIRRAARRGRSLAGLVPASVADYISKMALYSGRR